MPPESRRDHGTGSVYYDKARDRWVGTYETGWTQRGTRRRRKVTAATERGARQKLRAALNAASNDDTAAGGRLTVKRWADEWTEITAATHRPTTWRANQSLLGRWIIPTIGHKRLDQLHPKDVRAVSRAITAAGLAPSTATRAHAVLIKMLKDARADTHHVPLAAIETKGTGPGESDRDVIDMDDAVAILTAARNLPDGGSRWVAALLQGMRPAECLGLTWSAVDFEAGTVDVSWQLKPLPYKVPRDRSSGFRVPVDVRARRLTGAYHLVRPKTRSGQRVIPLVPWMAAALTDWRAKAPPSPHGLVWPAPNGGPMPDRDDRAAWRDLTDTARVAHVDEDNRGRRYHLYEARHTCASLLREARVDDTTIMAILGHSSILSTKAYLHANPARLRSALDGLADRYGLTAG